MIYELGEAPYKLCIWPNIETRILLLSHALLLLCVMLLVALGGYSYFRPLLGVSLYVH